MEDLAEFGGTIFAGCCANLGPMVGLDLVAQDVTLDATAPEGQLALLGVCVEDGGTPLARLDLFCAVPAILPMARLMLGSEDKDPEPTEDDIDAIGELLNLMSGAVDGAVRDQIRSTLHSRPLISAIEDELPESEGAGEPILVSGVLTHGADLAVPIFLRLPPGLQDLQSEVTGGPANGIAILLDTPDDVAGSLEPILGAALFGCERTGCDDDDANRKLAKATVIFMPASGSTNELMRRLRIGEKTWRTPIIAFAPEPTRDLVIEAMRDGASHVLALPTDAIQLIRVLNLRAGPEPS